MNPTIWLVLSTVRIFLSLTTFTVYACVSFFPWVFFLFESLEKIHMLFTGLGSVRIVKNRDFGLENALACPPLILPFPLHCRNTKGGNRIRMHYSTAQCDYLIIRIVLVYQWHENLQSVLYFQENKGIMLHTLARKQMYQVTSIGITSKIVSLIATSTYCCIYEQNSM